MPIDPVTGEITGESFTPDAQFAATGAQPLPTVPYLFEGTEVVDSQTKLKTRTFDTGGKILSYGDYVELTVTARVDGVAHGESPDNPEVLNRVQSLTIADVTINRAWNVRTAQEYH
jgi:hypothetical protein